MILFPILASFFQSASFCFDKIILTAKKATHKQYLAISFPLITIFTFIIFLIIKPYIGWDLFYGKYLFFLISSCVLMIASNLIFYNALKKDLLSEIQTIELLKNLPLIIINQFFYKHCMDSVFLQLPNLGNNLHCIDFFIAANNSLFMLINFF